MRIVTFLGYPRIGAQRALKRALESYWRGESSAKELLEVGRLLREEHWLVAHEAGADIVAVNDFSLYDHVLDTAALFDAIPARYRTLYDQNPLDGYFAMADRKSTRLNSSHVAISYAVFCLKKKT